MGDEWKKFSNLPFAFAVWASAKKIPDEIVKELNAAFQLGINSLHKVIAEEQKNYDGIDVSDYLKNGIDYLFNNEKSNAMNLFLRYVKESESVTG